ncbi:hypothetical protein BGX30_002461 [Mortierella sp. GBA39]|nr:hypothetical protein BGX30_002461 [Mortierella sp. GBA39]
MATYESNILTVKWLEQELRNAAIKKLMFMAKAIGYLINSPNATSSLSLSDFHQAYTVVADDFFANQVKYSLCMISAFIGNGIGVTLISTT